MVGETWALVAHFPRVHTLALCTLTRTNCRFVSPSIWVFQWDWRSISALEPVLHAGECARVTIWRTGCWCPICHKSAISHPTPELGKQEFLVRRSDQKLLIFAIFVKLYHLFLTQKLKLCILFSKFLKFTYIFESAWSEKFFVKLTQIRKNRSYMRRNQNEKIKFLSWSLPMIWKLCCKLWLWGNMRVCCIGYLRVMR